MYVCLKNACVQCNFDDGWDVFGVDGALSVMPTMVLAHVGELERVAGCLNVDGESRCVKSDIPFCGEAVDSVEESILGYGVEKPHQVVVGGM